MAAERAATSATMIQIEVCRLGMPRAANTAPVRPKGSVSTECSHLIISRVVPMLRNSGHGMILTCGPRIPDRRLAKLMPCGSGRWRDHCRSQAGT